MTLITHPASVPLTDAPRSRTDRRDDTDRRLAGISAIGFATLVLVANVLIGVQPERDAPAEEISRYVEGHQTGLAVSVALFAFATICMLVFTSAFERRLERACETRDLVWARIGTRSALLIIPMFAAVLVPRIVLVVGHDELIAQPALVALVWRFEMAAFTINTLAIAGALIGLGIAAARSGLVPRWFGVVGPVAAGVGVIGAAATVPALEGSPIGLAGIVPFLTWITFLIVAGVRQLRAGS